MASKVNAEKKNVVIVGAGLSSHLLIKELSKNQVFAITVIQGNDFLELAWNGALSITYTGTHAKAVDHQTIPGVKTVLGVASSVRDGVVAVAPLGGGASIEVSTICNLNGLEINSSPDPPRSTKLLQNIKGRIRLPGGSDRVQPTDSNCSRRHHFCGSGGRACRVGEGVDIGRRRCRCWRRFHRPRGPF